MVSIQLPENKLARRRTSAGKTLPGVYSCKTLPGKASNETSRERASGKTNTAHTASGKNNTRKPPAKKGISNKTVTGWALTTRYDDNEPESDEESTDAGGSLEPDSDQDANNVDDDDGENASRTDNTVNDDDKLAHDKELGGDHGLHPSTKVLSLERDPNSRISFTLTGFLLDELLSQNGGYTSAGDSRVKLIQEALGQDYIFDRICPVRSLQIMSEFDRFTDGQVDTAVAYGKQVAGILSNLIYNEDEAEGTLLRGGMVQVAIPDVEFQSGESFFGTNVVASVSEAVLAFNAHDFLRYEERLLDDLHTQQPQFEKAVEATSIQPRYFGAQRQKHKDHRHDRAILRPNSEFDKTADSDESPFEDSAPLGDDEDLFGEDVLSPNDSLKRKAETQIDHAMSQIPRAVKAAKTSRLDASSSTRLPLSRIQASEQMQGPTKTTTTSSTGTAEVRQSSPDETTGDLGEEELNDYIETEYTPILSNIMSDEDVHHTKDEKDQSRPLRQKFERRYFEGTNGTRLAIPTNEEMAAWRKPGRGEKCLAEQFRAWLRIHGGRTHGKLDNLERLVEDIIDRHTENGATFPQGYESVRSEGQKEATSYHMQQASTGLAEKSESYDHTRTFQAIGRGPPFIDHKLSSPVPLNRHHGPTMQQTAPNIIMKFQERPSASIGRRDSHQDAARMNTSHLDSSQLQFGGSHISNPGARVFS